MGSGDRKIIVLNGQMAWSLQLSGRNKNDLSYFKNKVEGGPV